MININNLTKYDIGREVSFIPKANKNREQLGKIVGFNSTYIFVNYSKTHELAEPTLPKDLHFRDESPEWVNLEIEGLEKGRYMINAKLRKVKSMVSKGNIHESKSGNVSLAFNVSELIKLMKNKRK